MTKRIFLIFLKMYCERKVFGPYKGWKPSACDRRSYTPRELSGGQQQRVAIARALIGSPEILFADEPTGNLDSKTGEEIMALLRKINREQGQTIIMVTHSPQAAESSTRTITVQDGTLLCP